MQEAGRHDPRGHQTQVMNGWWWGFSLYSTVKGVSAPTAACAACPPFCKRARPRCEQREREMDGSCPRGWGCHQSSTFNSAPVSTSQSIFFFLQKTSQSFAICNQTALWLVLLSGPGPNGCKEKKNARACFSSSGPHGCLVSVSAWGCDSVRVGCSPRWRSAPFLPKCVCETGPAREACSAARANPHPHLTPMGYRCSPPRYSATSAVLGFWYRDSCAGTL